MRHLIKKILREQITPNLPIKLSGSYRVPDTAPMKGDALHSFDARLADGFGGYMLRGNPPSEWSQYIKYDQGKSINQALQDVWRSGVNPDVTNLTVNVNSSNYTVNWEATIDRSKDGKAYLGLVTVGSCCSSSYSDRALGQVETMKTWNSKPKNHYLVADIQTTRDGKSNGNITIDGGNYKLRQIFYKYTYDNKKPH